MFEQDYIMRLIKEIIRVILKLLFNFDAGAPTEELINQIEQKENLDYLMDLADNGNINEAENELWELTSDRDMENLKTALLFYSYLNDKTDDFLNENNFSREEIKEGFKNLISKYGLGGITDLIT
ncbi:MAG: hypothetical protein K2M60_10755 [Lachnospiraceae bacterium]|nr:hypothetical protein [Lachnospiraceae bacterium]MDE6252247.1 hypothetical protein [Lachnospiraceae bacterium]